MLDTTKDIQSLTNFPAEIGKISQGDEEEQPAGGPHRQWQGLAGR
jgi:hypothetical protein